ncbi:MAG TPA: hypothetical protein VGC41_19360, partial [Kofleriaceae bacterium]
KGPDAAVELEQLWGPPKATTTRTFALHPSGTRIWYGDHVMAMLDPYNAAEQRHLSLVHYVPVAEELGDPARPLFGFERSSPIMGSDAKNLAERYKPAYETGRAPAPAHIHFPYAEAEPFDLTVWYDDHDYVTSYRFTVRANKEQVGEIQELVRKRFGQLPTDPMTKFDYKPCPAGTKCGVAEHYIVQIIPDPVTNDSWAITVMAPPDTAGSGSEATHGSAAN